MVEQRNYSADNLLNRPIDWINSLIRKQSGLQYLIVAEADRWHFEQNLFIFDKRKSKWRQRVEMDVGDTRKRQVVY